MEIGIEIILRVLWSGNLPQCKRTVVQKTWQNGSLGVG
jgi:hypothetical protein